MVYLGIQKPRRGSNHPEHDPRSRALSDPDSNSSPPLFPYGYCQCGCGQKTTIAKSNCNTYGWVKGEPKRYMSGHNRRLYPKPKADFLVEDRGHDTPCWIWQRSKRGRGYGALRKNGKTIAAHRYYYEQEYGPIPEGKELDHLCRVTSCVNPTHLEPVSRAVNTQRGLSAKLTMEKARSIRMLGQANLTQREIAERYEVDPTLVGAILRNRIWVE